MFSESSSRSLDEAEENKQEYLDLIEETQKNGIDGNYSLKPTSFGLLIDQEVCYRLMREIVAKAASFNNFCRIDMEDSPCTDLEIAAVQASSCRVSEKCRAGGTGLSQENPQ